MKGLESNFLHIFFLRTAGLFSACRSSCERAGQKRTEVLKKIIFARRQQLAALDNVSPFLSVAAAPYIENVHKFHAFYNPLPLNSL